jgi:hypothetical protein
MIVFVLRISMVTKSGELAVEYKQESIADIDDLSPIIRRVIQQYEYYGNKIISHKVIKTYQLP